MTGGSRYGAVTAKVRAMYGARLKTEDYRRLLAAQTVAEAAGLLREHPVWGGALAALEASDPRRGQVEALLRKHSLRHIIRLYAYLNREDKAVTMTPQAELEQLMRFMRLAAAGRAAEYTCDLPESIRKQSGIDFDRLPEAGSFDQLLSAVRGTGYHQALRRVRPPDGGFPSFLLVETQIRRQHRRTADALLRGKDGKAQRLLREAAGIQADWDNIVAVERILRHYPALKPDVFSYLLPAGAHLKPVELKAMIALDEADQLRGLVEHTDYGRLMEGHGDQTLEWLGRFILLTFYRRHMASGEPSVFMPVAYISLFQNELRNLIHVIESVRYRLPPEEAERYLVIL